MKTQPMIAANSEYDSLQDNSLIETEHASTVPMDYANQETAVTSEYAQIHATTFASNCYLNRELSWIKFNRRVLYEAGDSRTPILERIKFLAIVSANIDEFYMKRLGGLKQQIGAGVTRVTIDGRTPTMQLEQCRLMLLSLQKEKEAIYYSVLEKLHQHGIQLCSYAKLDNYEKQVLSDYYISHIQPLITPSVIDHSHPFPFMSNLSLNLFVEMKRQDHKGVLYARIKIPTGNNGVSRFVQVGNERKYIRLEELIIQHIDSLFPGAQILACDVFRITRNAITENDHSGMEDMLEIIASELRDRRLAPVVRLQTGKAMNPALKRTLAVHLGLDEEKDVFESAAMVCMSDLMEIASIDMPDLHDTPHRPVNNAKVANGLSVFDAIQAAGSILLQHPYESFATSVERFVREASQDSLVASIKMTLYRTSADTKILDHLVEAAQRGKQVAVVVELKARFDEEANVRWATRLEKAGVHVSYGVVNLKTHCKTILIVRKEQEGLRRYAHIGTGNYHAGTARLYSDLGLLTCDEKLTEDLTELFNYLATGCHPQRHYAQIMAAPLVIKANLLDKIEREIVKHSEDSPGLIRLKTNALEDSDITAALYAASQAGVKVELIVRDICRLRPGIAGLSENIRVVSIVGRFLEHSRIYYFRNNGDEEYYIGSADLMTRNLERRVELLIPIDNLDARNTLNSILEEQLTDTYCAWDMQPDGHYLQRRLPEQTASLSCQETAIRRTQEKQGTRRKRSSPEPLELSKQWLRLCF